MGCSGLCALLPSLGTFCEPGFPSRVSRLRIAHGSSLHRVAVHGVIRAHDIQSRAPQSSNPSASCQRYDLV